MWRLSSHPMSGLVVRVVTGALLALLIPSAHAYGDVNCARPEPDGVQPALMTVAYTGAAEMMAIPAVYFPARNHELTKLQLPSDLARLDTAARKAGFLETVLPLIVDVNRHILATRTRLSELVQLQHNGCELDTHELRWIAALAYEYETSSSNTKELLKRIDTIPVSLAAAQAAIESAWGTSRFVREGNALFGERTYDPSIPGMKVPNRTTFRVRSFPTLYDSVVQYANNLNTHEAYARFRSLRETQRTRGKSFDPNALAGTLDLYSEKGGWYTNTLVSIMSTNKFYELDAIHLAATN
jgi:Bax protein